MGAAGALLYNTEVEAAFGVVGSLDGGVGLCDDNGIPGTLVLTFCPLCNSEAELPATSIKENKLPKIKTLFLGFAPLLNARR
jgi:hypothetical protein